jgi:hypothetical protein
LLCFFDILDSSPPVRPGFHEFALFPNVSLNVRISEQTTFLFPFPCSDAIQFYSPSIGTPSDLCGRTPVVLSHRNLSLVSPARAICRFWVLPKPVCPSDNLVLSAETQLDASATSESQRFPICLFTQTEHAGSRMRVTAREATISYYDAALRRHSHCQGLASCEFQSARPFFARITRRATAHHFSISLLYRPRSPAKDGRNQCDVRPIGRDDLTFSGSLLANLSFVCLSSIQELRNRVLSLLLTILVTAAVLFVIHCLGVVKLFKFVRCGVRPLAEADYVTL